MTLAMSFHARHDHLCTGTKLTAEVVKRTNNDTADCDRHLVRYKCHNKCTSSLSMVRRLILFRAFIAHETIIRFGFYNLHVTRFPYSFYSFALFLFRSKDNAFFGVIIVFRLCSSCMVSEG